MPTPPSELDESQTRQRILDAAHRVFLTRGTAAARTQHIADEAGVNKALIHYYYGTKSALADAVFAHHVRTFLPRLFAILGDPDRYLEDKVHDVVREQMDFHCAHPYVAGYLAAELHAEPERLTRLVGAHGGPPLDVLARQLAVDAEAGLIRPISVQQFVATLIGAVVIPFVMRPIMTLFLGLEGERMQEFLAERRRVLPAFILAGLRP